jgi:hypothetical protein
MQKWWGASGFYQATHSFRNVNNEQPLSWHTSTRLSIFIKLYQFFIVLAGGFLLLFVLNDKGHGFSAFVGAFAETRNQPWFGSLHAARHETNLGLARRNMYRID